jgi:hypothetical protein
MKKYSTIAGEMLSPLTQCGVAETVKKYRGNYRSHTVTAENLLRVGVCAQMQGLGALREISTVLEANRSQLYHGALKEIKRSTLSDALSRIKNAIFEEIFQKLAAQACRMRGKRGRQFVKSLKIIDATVITCCLKQFDWAEYRTGKGAIKIHTKIDGDNLYPEQAVISNGNVSDCKKMDELTQEKGVIYTFDRAYMDFKSLHKIKERGSSFVVRLKQKVDHEVVKVNSRSADKAVRADETIELTGAKTSMFYPENLRMVIYYDSEHNRELDFITNIRDLSAQQIADIYKRRWQVELFFKWLKQNLHVTSFWGRSENAVKSQIWFALIAALLLWLFRQTLAKNISAHTILQRIRPQFFSRVDLFSVLFPPVKPVKLKFCLSLWEVA